eukprot:TRINITY_DN1724_c0_g1_i4.p1 TRINITY_DN1724_c0_g1~~TRINITY_DN1724_c0_g1_i4.p1  ORF type:complete len:632 (+),score=161.99 TRINITY_DN1724_c0_g1_i4:605-2500(+)
MGVLYHLAKHWKIRWGFTDAIWRVEYTILLAAALIILSLIVFMYTIVEGILRELSMAFPIVTLLYTIGILIGLWTSKSQHRILPFALASLAPLMVMVIPGFILNDCKLIQNKQPYPYLVLLLLTANMQVLVSETWVRMSASCYSAVLLLFMILFENKHDSRLCDSYINLYDEVAYFLFGLSYVLLLVLITWITNRLWRLEGIPLVHEYPVTPRLDDRTKLLEAIELLRGRGIDEEVDNLEQLALSATRLSSVPVMPYIPLTDTGMGKRASARSVASHHRSTPAPDCDLYSVIESECLPLSTHDHYQPRESYGMFSLCTPTGDMMAKSCESLGKSHGYVPMASSFETALEPEDGRCSPLGMSMAGLPLPSTFGSDYDSGNSSYLVVKHFETMLADPELIQHLSRGGVLFCIACKLRRDLIESEVRLIECFVNMTSFEDEVTEAGTIKVDMRGEMDLDYTFWRNTAVYFLPNIRPEDVNATVVSSYEYQKACQPSGTHVWPDVQAEDTFRITKTIIPLVFKITIQFKCSDVPEEFLPALSCHMSGLRVHKAILMERTRRSKGGLDVCKKCKSLLLYHFLPNGGAIVCNPVALVNSSIPSVLVSIIDKVGSMGGKEVAICAKLARQYLNKNDAV